MASLPRQPLGFQQRSSSQQSPPLPEDEASQRQRRSSIPQSFTSEDSQTVLLNHPSSSSGSSPKPEDLHKREMPSKPQVQASASSEEPRKCWICFSDETEDSPTSAEWRSPCPCALRAHEDCLLDWVAAEEAPEKRRTGTSRIQCPQCKADITIARPRSYLVDGVTQLERASSRLVFPFVMVTLAGTVITGCWMHGFSTVYLLFGAEDADRVLGVDSGFGISSNWGLGLPLIPVALVASRITWADSVLPVLPIFYFASGAPKQSAPLWPPSAAMTIAILPYIRAVYNEIYKRIFAEKEKQWIKEVHPRGGEDENIAGQGGDAGPADDMPQEGMNIELGLEVEVIEEEEEEVEEEADHRHANEAGENIAAQARNQEGIPGQGNGQEGQEGPNQRNRNQHLHGLLEAQGPEQDGQRQNLNGVPITLSMNRVAETIIGALLFPTVSTSMGALLKALLPRTWTTPPRSSDSYPAGLLQSRFGRSIVGGCVFVVLKDSLLLYAKYRRAQNHKQRRVVDYNASKVKKKA